MAYPHVPLEYGAYYHIYNRGINSCPIFTELSNYEFFLSCYDKHITPIAETFAWVLMGNHFHLLIKIKEEKDIGYIPTDDEKLPPKKFSPTNQFKHLFNGYAQYFNKKYDRTGGLFETPFRRIEIESNAYFTNVAMYIHNNPVHHGFCSHAKEYPWSSYDSIISNMPTKLKRESVIEWFGGTENFKLMHSDFTFSEVDINSQIEELDVI